LAERTVALLKVRVEPHGVLVAGGDPAEKVAQYDGVAFMLIRLGRGEEPDELHVEPAIDAATRDVRLPRRAIDRASRADRRGVQARKERFSPAERLTASVQDGRPDTRAARRVWRARAAGGAKGAAPRGSLPVPARGRSATPPAAGQDPCRRPRRSARSPCRMPFPSVRSSWCDPPFATDGSDGAVPTTIQRRHHFSWSG